MYAKFEHKIKTPQQLAELVGRRPRRQRVIMCHGTFDIVHPGHMRHLMYAKEKADVLVVSVTADEHISKGPYRPYVPQELRAANLAAFEFVEYVVIDRNAHGVIVQLRRPAVIAPMPGDLPLGEPVEVTLAAVDPVARRIELAPA